MTRDEYWIECVSVALEEAGVSATPEQIASIAETVAGGHETIGCPKCDGSGRLQYNSGPWAMNTQCDTCHGDGKVHPSKS